MIPLFQQLVLNLPLDPSLSEAAFIETPANWEALTWIKRWPQWSSRFIVFYGDKGCGKTHLAHIWKEKTGAFMVTPADIPYLSPLECAHHHSCFVLDDYDSIEDEEWLFHFYNSLQEKQCYLLICGQLSPAIQPFKLPDLKSRLRSLLSIQIRLPDENLLKGLITKLFHDQGLESNPEINDYLSHRVERSYKNIHQLVKEIDYYAHAMKKPLTLALVRHVLAKHSEEPEL